VAKNHLTKELHQYVTGKQGKIKVQHTTTAASGSAAISLNYGCDSSSTDNEQLEPMKGGMTSRVRSLERNLAATASERVEKKGTQKRNSKQKRNLSLDNSRHLPPGHLQREVGAASKHGHDADIRTRKERNRKLYSEGAQEVAPTEVNDLDDVYSVLSYGEGKLKGKQHSHSRAQAAEILSADNSVSFSRNGRNVEILRLVLSVVLM